MTTLNRVLREAIDEMLVQAIDDYAVCRVCHGLNGSRKGHESNCAVLLLERASRRCHGCGAFEVPMRPVGKFWGCEDGAACVGRQQLAPRALLKPETVSEIEAIEVVIEDLDLSDEAREAMRSAFSLLRMRATQPSGEFEHGWLAAIAACNAVEEVKELRAKKDTASFAEVWSREVHRAVRFVRGEACPFCDQLYGSCICNDRPKVVDFGTLNKIASERIVYAEPKEAKRSPVKEVARLRELLRQYDEGMLTAMSVVATYAWETVEQIAESVRDGREWMMFQSWCGSEPPAPSVVRAEISIGSDHVKVTPLSSG